MAATWITADDCLPRLGIAPAATVDVDHLANVVAAANDLAYDRRLAAGYVDDPLIVPSDRVREGTIRYAVQEYRSRGAVDGYASFEETSGFAPTGGDWGAILKLWGVPRMAVG